METAHERMLDRNVRPDEDSAAEYMGTEAATYWQRMLQFIDRRYPGVFQQDDWIFGGKKHGWALRFKKSSSFCTLVPERGRLLVVIVFGRKEQEKAENLVPDLSSCVRETYLAAPTYADGKWMAIAVDSDSVFEDITKLLAIKRKPRE